MMTLQGIPCLPIDQIVHTIKIVQISFDPEKNERNIRERNLPFAQAVDFDFNNALVEIDSRHAYGEKRYVALGHLRGRLHVLCFTETLEGIRVISFRKANEREVKRHGRIQAPD